MRKRYSVMRYAAGSGLYKGVECDEKHIANRIAKKYIADGWEGVALVDTAMNAVLDTIGNFPELKKVFRGYIRDFRLTPDNIRTLAHFKKFIGQKRPFRVLMQYDGFDLIWKVMVPNLIRANGAYCIVKDEPDNKINQLHDGKGYWLPFKSANWDFKYRKITLLSDDKTPILVLRFL